MIPKCVIFQCIALSLSDKAKIFIFACSERSENLSQEFGLQDAFMYFFFQYPGFI
jgi:hypothetical protein